MSRNAQLERAGRLLRQGRIDESKPLYLKGACAEEAHARESTGEHRVWKLLCAAAAFIEAHKLHDAARVLKECRPLALMYPHLAVEFDLLAATLNAQFRRPILRVVK